MTATPQTRTNPYVGPRAFQQGEKLYGRDREVTQLLHLLMAERIVLFYSPSGAGKTSLIQAALIPELEKDGFHVLPPMRVSLDPPPDEQVDRLSNRYVFSLLLSLEETLPPEQRMPLAELSTLTLAEYLDRRRDGDEAVGTVLIFDQFEEILTLDPIDREQKLEFFAQVGEALRNRRRWALFAMREEFIAGLEEPYLRPIPTRLQTGYRLGLLGLRYARQAIQEPAKAAGVTFTDAAADNLVRDLSTVRVLQPDGSMGERLGPHVEPVQLQVVCRRLWDLLPDGASQIAEEDIGLLADVDLALSGYYADEVKAARSGYYADQVKAADSFPSRFGVYLSAFAAALGIGRVAERTIRNWFDRELITEQGIRGQVLKGPDESEGLDNRAIRPLVDAHLVRAEKRRGATWFELAHDRLIEPVQASNAAWRRARLTRWIAVGATLAIALALGVGLFVGWDELAVAAARADRSAALATQAAAEQARDAAITAQTAAVQARDTAIAAEGTAIAAEEAAVAAQWRAEQARDTAIAAERTAVTAQSAAEETATAAQTAAADAEGTAIAAQTAAADAEGTAIAAQTAAADAEGTAIAAQTAAADAEGTATAAQTAAAAAEGTAVAAQSAAEQERDAAEETATAAQAAAQQARHTATAAIATAAAAQATIAYLETQLATCEVPPTPTPRDVVTVGYEDLPMGGGNDWDYNDLVIDITWVLEVSAQDDLLAATFTITQEPGAGPTAGMTAYKHEFHLQPYEDAFTCDGRYTLRTTRSGSTSTETGVYTRGRDFTIIPDTRHPPKSVELSIEFDAPPGGGCPFEFSNLDPVSSYHGRWLFFDPWLKVKNTGESIRVKTAPYCECRILTVPVDWEWPKPDGNSIWNRYPKVKRPEDPNLGPIFEPEWWK